MHGKGMFNHRHKGFTLIELLVVIAIIGVLSTMTIVALGDVRTKSRDAKRVADIQQISKALELYYADQGYYPTLITPGTALASSDGSKVYMTTIPNNPSPRNENGCGDNNYTYGATANNNDYSLNFCLGSGSGTLSRGINSASSAGLGTAAGLVGWWKFDEGSGTTAYDSSGSGQSGSWTGTWTTGKSGGAVTCSGSNYVSLSYSPLYDFGLTNFTVLAWINSSTGQSHDVVSNRTADSAAYKGFSLFTVNSGNGYVQGRLVDGVNSPYAGYYAPWSMWGQWIHIGFVVDRSSATLTAYFNGAASTPASIATLGNISVANGVKFCTGAKGAFTGDIDEVRIYNRALSTTEIKAMYDATK